jgi:hypothetical protein
LREVVMRITRRLQASVAEMLGGGDGAEARAALVLAALWGMGLYGWMMDAPPADASASFIDTVARWASGGGG